MNYTYITLARSPPYQKQLNQDYLKKLYLNFFTFQSNTKYHFNSYNITSISEPAGQSGITTIEIALQLYHFASQT